MTPTQAAKLLGIKRKDLFAYLQDKGWVYRDKRAKTWTAYSCKVQSGHLELDTHLYERSDGRDGMSEQVVITSKGVSRIAHDMGLSEPELRLFP